MEHRLLSKIKIEALTLPEPIIPGTWVGQVLWLRPVVLQGRCCTVGSANTPIGALTAVVRRLSMARSPVDAIRITIEERLRCLDADSNKDLRRRYSISTQYKLVWIKLFSAPPTHKQIPSSDLWTGLGTQGCVVSGRRWW